MKLDDLVIAMQSIESDRKLTKEIVVDALQEALVKAFHKHIDNSDAYARVDIDDKKQTIRLFRRFLVVETVEDEELEISLENAKKIKETYKVDDYVEEEIEITDFGRAAVILAKNVMKQKIREAEKTLVFETYCDKVDEMVMGTIESVEEKFCLVNIGKTIALMPMNQQIPNERYYDGQMLRVVIVEVNKETKGAQVLVSRSHATLVKRLFEKEVPEIYQGVIEIRAIAREAGERTKMAVYSRNENIDPIGACIGPRGQRVQVVIDELRGEKIDIFEWSEDISELIKNALSPADVLAVIPSNERKDSLMVIVPDNQLSLAIGKRGKNARLAVKLTSSKIDIRSESDANESGVDWKKIAKKHQEEFNEAVEQARAKAQKEAFENAKASDGNVSLADAGVDFVETKYVESPVVFDQDTSKSEANPTKKVSVAKEKVVKEKANDLEEAAKIAKEKSKKEGFSSKEKSEYKSKFESLADAKNKQENRAVKPKPKKSYGKGEEEVEEVVRTSTFDLSNKDYELKPVYSEEELAEIARKQKEQEESDWIHDEIDFDEFDEYYEEK